MNAFAVVYRKQCDPDQMSTDLNQHCFGKNIYEPRHEISNNVVCASSKASDQPAHTCSLIRAFASRLNIL